MITADGQGCGGVRGHLHLPRRHSFALSGQAVHRSNPRCVTSQWTNLTTLCFREGGNQEVDSRVAAERSHPSEFITLWEPDRAGTEEGWDLETLY